MHSWTNREMAAHGPMLKIDERKTMDDVQLKLLRIEHIQNTPCLPNSLTYNKEHLLSPILAPFIYQWHDLRDVHETEDTTKASSLN